MDRAIERLLLPSQQFAVPSSSSLLRLKYWNNRCYAHLVVDVDSQQFLHRVKKAREMAQVTKLALMTGVTWQAWFTWWQYNGQSSYRLELLLIHYSYVIMTTKQFHYYQSASVSPWFTQPTHVAWASSLQRANHIKPFTLWYMGICMLSIVNLLQGHHLMS